ncbi:MAG: hypothetical protein FWG40_02630 [Peptococcaceae bacterium]|nr:hypothetical protein [Peptococcaceae bacterium]
MNKQEQGAEAMKKSVILAAGGIIIILLFVTFLLMNTNDKGVQQIRIVENSSEWTIVINYIDIGGYSIRKMDKDENEEVYFGEILVEDDGLLGENRIEIMFYGAKASYKLINRYPFGIVHKLKDVPADLKSNFNIRTTSFPGFSGFAVRIGSNEPINIEEQDYTQIHHAIGSIKITIEQ